jgi:hypothetical protein
LNRHEIAQARNQQQSHGPENATDKDESLTMIFFFRFLIVCIPKSFLWPDIWLSQMAKGRPAKSCRRVNSDGEDNHDDEVAQLCSFEYTLSALKVLQGMLKKELGLEFGA